MSYADELEEFLKEIEPFTAETYREKLALYTPNMETNPYRRQGFRFMSSAIFWCYHPKLMGFYHEINPSIVASRLDKEFNPRITLYLGFSSMNVSIHEIEYVRLFTWMNNNRPGVLGVEPEWDAQCTITRETWTRPAGTDLLIETALRFGAIHWK